MLIQKIGVYTKLNISVFIKGITLFSLLYEHNYSRYRSHLTLSFVLLPIMFVNILVFVLKYKF